MGLRAWLRGHPARQRRFFVVLAGLCIAVYASLGSGKELKDAFENMTSADQLTKLSTFFAGPLDRALPVTIVAIDEPTRRAWGSLPATPRAPLALLIKLAREAKAEAILLDIDLTAETEGELPHPGLAGEIALYPSDAPLLMLVRRLAGGASRTAYDPAITSQANVVWVVAQPQRDKDNVVRKIKLWESVCAGPSGVAYGAPPLHLAARAKGMAGALKAFLIEQAEFECGAKPRRARGWPAGAEKSARLPFVIWGDADTIGTDYIRYGGVETKLVIGPPARDLIAYADGKAEAKGVISPSLFKGRVVVIGVTHSLGRDIHGTPLGLMPGAVILANASAMANYIADTPEFPPGKKLAIAFALFIVLGALGIRLQMAASTLIVGTISLVLLIALARWIGYGAAIEIMAYVLVMYGLLKFTDSLLTIIHDWRGGAGWRAVFKPHRDPPNLKT